MGIKHPFNSISHMVGGGLALALTPVMAAQANGTLAVAAVSVYGCSLVIMYTLSVMFHAIPHQRAQFWLFRLDQVGIYVLIAGTYTPIALLRFGGAIGWNLFVLEWVLAGAGIVLLLTVPKTPQWVHQTAYIVLGWAAIIGLPSLLRLPGTGLALLVGGGILYTVGAYLNGRHRPRVIGPLGDHEVWHLMVLAGSALHAGFVLAHVV